QFTHFGQGTTQVSVDGGVTVQSVTVGNATSLTAQLTIPATAAVGSRTLTVTTGGEVVTLNNGFTVQPGIPVLTTANPNSGQQGDAVTVSITGQFTGFVQGTTQVSLGDGVAVNSVTVSGSSSLTLEAS